MLDRSINQSGGWIRVSTTGGGERGGDGKMKVIVGSDKADEWPISGTHGENKTILVYKNIRSAETLTGGWTSKER